MAQQLWDQQRFLWVCRAPRKMMWSTHGAGKTPVIAGDTILFAAGYPYHDQIFLTAVDKKTGKRKWTCDDAVDQFKLDDQQVVITSLGDFFKREPSQPQQGWIR